MYRVVLFVFVFSIGALAQQTSTLCQFTNGPRNGQILNYAPLPALLIGSPCNDGVNSTGKIVGLDSLPGKALNIAGVTQDTAVYCWAASGEMIFRYYNIPSGFGGASDQCSIVQSVGGPFSPCWQNCHACTWPAGNPAVIEFMIHTYGEVSRMLTHNQNIPRLKSDFKVGPLSESEIRAEIDADRPILIALNPSLNGAPVPEHAIVIRGYRMVPAPVGALPGTPDQMWVIVNDPYPYFSFGYAAPYQVVGGFVLAGGLSFAFPYQVFQGPMPWVWTFYHISKAQ
jgi:hypothetical protein